MVDAEAQGVFDHHLRIRHAAAPGFEAPGPATQGQALFKSAIEVADEAAQRFGDRLADGRADDREQRIDNDPAITLDRIPQRRGDRRRQRAVQCLTAVAALRGLEQLRQLCG